MTPSTPPPNGSQPTWNDALRTLQAIADMLHSTVNAAGDAFVSWVYPAIEQATEVLGRTVAPIADLPFIKFATGVPGLSWLLAALGQVNADKVHTAVDELRRQHPLETDEQLAHRVMVTSAWRAAQVGLITNIVPPVATVLLAIDIGAIAALQAEMIYKIAAIYGFPADDATRRGEVLAIWAVFTSSSGTLKSGLSFLEVLPAAGAAIGITADAAILYGVGFLACRFYEVKQTRQFRAG